MHYWVAMVIIGEVFILSAIMSSTILLGRIMIIKLSWVLIINCIWTINSSLRIFNTFCWINTDNIAGIWWWGYSKLVLPIRFWNWDDSIFFILLLLRSLLSIDYILITVWHWIVNQETLIIDMTDCVVYIVTWTLLSFETFNSHLLIATSLRFLLT